jgi:hypothetical protein
MRRFVMAYNKDWMPGPRSEILAMCQKWIMIMDAETRTAWGVPSDEFIKLGSVYAAAQELLTKAMAEEERTPVVTEQCREAFDALKEKMRFFKNHYFLVPPLSNADLIRLGLKVPDPRPTPIPAPKDMPMVSLSYPGGPRLMAAHLGPMPGTEELDPRSDYGYALYVGMMPPGGATLEQAASRKHYLMAPPKDGEGLTHYRFTRRRKERIVFSAEEAGMTAYVCARYENDKGEVGLWGPLTSMVVP